MLQKVPGNHGQGSEFSPGCEGRGLGGVEPVPVHGAGLPGALSAGIWGGHESRVSVALCFGAILGSWNGLGWKGP